VHGVELLLILDYSDWFQWHVFRLICTGAQSKFHRFKAPRMASNPQKKQKYILPCTWILIESVYVVHVRSQHPQASLCREHMHLQNPQLITHNIYIYITDWISCNMVMLRYSNVTVHACAMHWAELNPSPYFLAESHAASDLQTVSSCHVCIIQGKGGMTYFVCIHYLCTS
jgi:hypothetical protein